MQKRFFYLNGHPYVFLSTTGHGAKGATEEATLAFERLNQELQELGGSIEDVVRTTIFTRNQECRPAISEVRKKIFSQATRPASSSIIVHNFSPADSLIEIDATAFLSRGKQYRKQGYEFAPPRAYIKAVEVEDVLFISGQTERGENVEVQTTACCSRIRETMAELGFPWENLLLVSSYVKKIEWFDCVYQIIKGNVGNKPVSIDLVRGDEYAQPEVLVEIEATACK